MFPAHVDSVARDSCHDDLGLPTVKNRYMRNYSCLRVTYILAKWSLMLLIFMIYDLFVIIYYYYFVILRLFTKFCYFKIVYAQ